MARRGGIAWTALRGFGSVGVWVVRAASENGEDGTETLRTRLGCAKHIQISLAWRAKVGSAVHIDVKVQRSP